MATIAVVDDEGSIRMLVSYVLRSLGHTVEAHGSADEFFQRTSPEPVDLVITDFIMPRVDGFEFCRQLRGLGDPPPVVVMTGFELEPLIEQALTQRLGVVGVLGKPFLAAALIDIVQRALQGPRAQPDAAPAVTDNDATREEARIAEAVRAVGARLQPRLNAALDVTVAWDGGEIAARTIDVSASGMLIAAARAPAQHEDVTLTIGGASSKPITLHGTVAHVREAHGHTAATGVQFGVTLHERRVQSFYAWYQMMARLQQHRPAEPARYNLRAPLLGDAMVSCDGNQAVRCALGDIGEGGLRIYGDAPLPQATSLTVRFSLPNDPEPQSSHATVRWMQREGPKRVVYGLEFDRPEPETKAAIVRYVEQVA